MLMSFILNTTGINIEEFHKTFNSIINQTDDDYEVVIILDNGKLKEDSEFTQFLRSKFTHSENIKLIMNGTMQGCATSRNMALEITEGEYVVFASEGDEYNENYIKTIKSTIKKNGSVDMIEYQMHLVNKVDICSISYLEQNKVYNLLEDLDPIAYTNDLLENKIFKSKILQNSKLKFKKMVRYDALFFFKFLGQIKTYLYIQPETPILDHQIMQSDYSVFDSVNQWPHILNFYRRIGKYKVAKDYLYYSYFKSLLHRWLWAIRKYENKQLIKKSVSFAERKFADKQADFIKNNKIFKIGKDKKFQDIATNFTKYTKTILKNIK